MGKRRTAVSPVRPSRIIGATRLTTGWIDLLNRVQSALAQRYNRATCLFVCVTGVISAVRLPSVDR